jgi:hypothetical protein
LALLLAFAAALATYAVLRGQTSNWDLRNYHLYSPWAWLNGRLDRDLAAAHLQSFYNPLLYVPVYLGAMTLPPRVLVFGIASLQALNALPLFVLARALLPQRLQSDGPWLAATLAMIGACGATQIGELGATQGDNLVTLPLLCGLALLVCRPQRIWAQCLAGLLFGACAGLKLTFAPWVAGAVLGVPLLFRGALAGQGPPYAGLMRVGLSALLGFALCAGPWMYEMWSRYGNPVFPLFGALFPGSLQVPFETRDMRFVPVGWVQTLLYPLYWLLHPRRVSEIWWRDLRVPLLFLAALVLPWWRARRAALVDDSGIVGARGSGYLGLVALVGYVGWLGLFGYYRYLAPLEMLAPLLFVLVVAYAFPTLDSRRTARYVAPLLFLAIFTTRAPDWGHVHYGERFLVAQAPKLPAGATLVFADEAPLAFLALVLGPEVDYVRVNGNLFGGGWPPYALDLRVAANLDGASGPLYAVLQGEPNAAKRAALARFGLELDESGCALVTVNLIAPDSPQARLCPLHRVRSAQAAIQELIAYWRQGCNKAAAKDREVRKVCRVLEHL